MLALRQILVILSSFIHLLLAAGPATPIVAQYWPAYSSALQSPQEIPWSTADIMLYFVTVTAEDGFKLPEGQSEKDMQNFVSLAHKNNVKPVFTIGGWTGSTYFSRIAAASASRKKFAVQIRDFLQDHRFAGVDLDWEFPGEDGIGYNSPDPAHDANNFLLLLQEIRWAIGPDALITGAVSMKGFSVNGKVLDDLSPFARWFDLILLMAYDVSGPTWSEQTGPLAPLHACSSGVGVDTAIAAWTSRGFPAEKILLGLPGYGISFQTRSSQLTNSTTTIGGYSTQLYNDKTNCVPKGDSSDTGGDPAGATEACGQSQTSMYSGQWKMKNMIKEGILSKDEKRGLKGFKRVWDECTRTPFLFNARTRTLISYEDSMSIKLKAEYAMSKGLGGAMIFDTLGFSNDVYKALRRGLGRVHQGSSTTIHPNSGASLQAQAALGDLEDTDTSKNTLIDTKSSTFVEQITTLSIKKPTASALATSSKPTETPPASSASTSVASTASSSPSPAPAASLTLTNGANQTNFIRCDTSTAWSLCTSDLTCTTMGDVSPGTECHNGQIICVSSHSVRKRQLGPPMLMRGKYEGSARFAAGHRWRRV